jgi:hypothetical protein
MPSIKHIAMFVVGVYASVAAIKLINGLAGGRLPLAPQ